MNKRNEKIHSLLESLRQQTNEMLGEQVLYTEMVENNPDGLIVVDGDGVIQFANKTAAEMFNRKRAKNLEGEIFAFNPAENEIAEIEIANKAKIGIVEMRSRKIDWTGLPAKLIMLSSVTERGKIRSSLQKASESLKAMINASPLAIIVVDIGGAVTLWSKAAEHIFDWSESEMRGQPFPFNNSPLEEIIDRALSGKQIFQQEFTGSFGLYGLEKTLHLWATSLKNDRGMVSGVMLMIADVTQTELIKKQMESALLKSEERFRIALCHSPISVFCQDSDFRYTWVYNSFAGIQEVQMIGKTDIDLFSKEDSAQLNELKSCVLRLGVENRGEIKILRDERMYFYDISVEPLLDDSGNITGVSCAATDI